jgi:hypothetical protein
MVAAKCRPAVVFSLMWKPFDAFFEEILQELRFHSDLVKEELTLVQLELSITHNQSDVEERRRAAEDRIAAAKTRKTIDHSNSLASETLKLLEKKYERAAP